MRHCILKSLILQKKVIFSKNKNFYFVKTTTNLITHIVIKINNYFIINKKIIWCIVLVEMS